MYMQLHIFMGISFFLSQARHIYIIHHYIRNITLHVPANASPNTCSNRYKPAIHVNSFQI